MFMDKGLGFRFEAWGLRVSCLLTSEGSKECRNLMTKKPLEGSHTDPVMHEC